MRIDSTDQRARPTNAGGCERVRWFLHYHPPLPICTAQSPPCEGLTDTQEGAHECVLCCVMHGGLGWIIRAMIIVSGRVPACPRFQIGAPRVHSCWEAISTMRVIRVLTQYTQHVGRVLWTFYLVHLDTLELLFPSFWGCGFSTVRSPLSSPDF